MKSWTKCLVATVLLLALCGVLAVGIYFAFEKWAGSGSWKNAPCNLIGETCPETFSGTPPVIVVSLDGFRASYLLKKLTPVFDKFKGCGVSAPYMRSVYPTKTFINHYAMVTGLFAESHGIVANVMYDEALKEVFTHKDTMYDPRWWFGEPIWNTVTKHNKTAAALFWVGSDVKIQGMRPKYWEHYDQNYPFEKRVDAALKWIDLPKESRPDFINLYFTEPDATGHDYGPDSKEVEEMLVKVDAVVEMLMDGLYARRLHNCINVIIVADHGMSSVSCSRIVVLKDHISVENMRVFGGTYGRINTKYLINGTQATPVQKQVPEGDIVDGLRCVDDHLQATFKWDLPKRLHYVHSRRIEDIVLNMDDEWLVAGSDAKAICNQPGKHGYDDVYKSMEAIFFAHGPSFKQNCQISPFLNVELYNLFTELANITGAPNNGTMGSLHHILKHPTSLPGRNALEKYLICEYPRSETVYNERRNAQPDCSCTLPHGKTIPEMDYRLNITDERQAIIQRSAVHSGLPYIQMNASACVLTQEEYVTGYSHIYHSPLWVAYSLNRTVSFNSTAQPSCMRPDVRLDVNVSANCKDFDASVSENVTMGLLFDPGYSADDMKKMDAMILSNVVPMYAGFKQGIWQHLLSKIAKWHVKYGDLQVISGPIYDYNGDGLHDDYSQIKSFLNNGSVPIPTHYYTVILKCCKDQSQNDTETIMAFALPHKNTPTSCKPEDDYLFEHSARVKDVELLTGLEFFTSYDHYDAIALETFLMDSIWPVE